MKKLAAVVYTAYALAPSGSWSMPDVRSAIDQHELGDFSKSAVLAESLDRDPRIKGAFDTRIAALIAKGGDATFAIKPSDYGDPKLAEQAVELVDGDWWNILPEWVQRRLLRDLIKLGVAFAQRVWTPVVRGGVRLWSLKIEPWDARYFSWEPVSRRYQVTTEQGLITIEPGDPGWAIFELSADRPWMGGLIRSLPDLAVFRGHAYRDWARYCERHGLPIVALREPASADADDKQKFFEDVRGMGSKAVVRLPQGDSAQTSFDLDIVEPQDGAWDTFRAFIVELRTEITTLIKGENLTTEVQGGSYAAAKTHSGVSTTVLSSDAESFATACRQQVLEPWGQFNFSWWTPEITPWPCWDTGEPDNLVAAANTLSTAGDALGKFIQLGIPVDVEKFCARFNLPLREGGRVPEPEAPEDSAPEPTAEQPAAEPPTPGDEPVPDTVDTAREVRATAAFARGQTVADGLVDQAVERARRALSPDLALVAEAAQQATDYDDLRRRIKESFSAMSPAGLAALTSQALILAELVGIVAVQDETKS